MKDVKSGTICAIISMLSVVVMIIWGYAADDFGHSWLALLIGGVISCSIHLIMKDKDNARKDKKEDKKEQS